MQNFLKCLVNEVISFFIDIPIFIFIHFVNWPSRASFLTHFSICLRCWAIVTFPCVQLRTPSLTNKSIITNKPSQIASKVSKGALNASAIRCERVVLCCVFYFAVESCSIRSVSVRFLCTGVVLSYWNEYEINVLLIIFTYRFPHLKTMLIDEHVPRHKYPAAYSVCKKWASSVKLNKMPKY